MGILSKNKWSGKRQRKSRAEEKPSIVRAEDGGG